MYVGQRKREQAEPDRALPSLIDRLKVNDPPDDGHQVEELKQILIRDLTALMNSRRYFEDDEDISEQLQESVLNFGIPDFCGSGAAAEQLLALRRAVRDAIARYEPRLRLTGQDPVRIVTRSTDGRPVLLLEIQGELRSDPYPVHLRIRTEIDRETGVCTVRTEEGASD
ncbi:MAG: type VI secretion system baseplate subunit TssE [Phycisphaerales bacterium]|nr:type VI secretion system baseplate subunit TssE [Phycisphaerales bacterium]